PPPRSGHGASRERLRLDGLHGAGDRPSEAEHVECRPPDPDRRPRGQAARGGALVRLRVLTSAVALIIFQGVSLAQEKPLPDLPDYVFAVLPEDENLDVVF